MRFPAQTRESPHFPASTRAIVKHFWSVLLALARRPYLTRMDVAKIMRALEAAWQHALPGRQSCARDHVMRELWRLLQQQPAAPSRCACVWSAPRAC